MGHAYAAHPCKSKILKTGISARFSMGVRRSCLQADYFKAADPLIRQQCNDRADAQLSNSRLQQHSTRSMQHATIYRDVLMVRHCGRRFGDFRTCAHANETKCAQRSAHLARWVKLHSRCPTSEVTMLCLSDACAAPERALNGPSSVGTCRQRQVRTRPSTSSTKEHEHFTLQRIIVQHENSHLGKRQTCFDWLDRSRQSRAD